jgi:hypothetical protein
VFPLDSRGRRWHVSIMTGPSPLSPARISRWRILPHALAACLALLATGAAAQTGNPSHDAVAALTEPARQTEFLRAIRSGGNVCPGVAATFFAGFDRARTAFWDIRCQGGPSYRVTLPAERFQRPSLVACGLGMQGGPCFRPIAATAAAAPAVPRQEAICRSTCGTQPASAGAACLSQCLSGQGVGLADARPAAPGGARFGAVYSTDPPLAAVGFANGDADRLAVNMAAVRACQDRAGRTPCHFRQEIVGACGAVAMARGAAGGAMVMTDDLSTQRLARTSVAVGATQAAAEADALAACRAAEGPGIACRIVASGC